MPGSFSLSFAKCQPAPAIRQACNARPGVSEVVEPALRAGLNLHGVQVPPSYLAGSGATGVPVNLKRIFTSGSTFSIRAMRMTFRFQVR
ncbi:MAG: hypothetical protein JWQ62_2273 [Lacunisphaera sp.]|nr:hypothetical protein [Lacunisphaera sp.]